MFDIFVFNDFDLQTLRLLMLQMFGQGIVKLAVPIPKRIEYEII